MAVIDHRAVAEAEIESALLAQAPDRPDVGFSLAMCKIPVQDGTRTVVLGWNIMFTMASPLLNSGLLWTEAQLQGLAVTRQMASDTVRLALADLTTMRNDLLKVRTDSN